MPYNTGNPIPSSDAKDLSDNAENLDNSVNTALDTWTDRLGVERRTIQGQLKLLGYTPPDVYAGGLVFTIAENMATIDRNGTIYAPKPSAIPFTTSGTWTADDENKFFVVQGATLDDVVISANTVADMKTKDLQPGQFIRTKGYYAEGDAGGATYLIKTAAEFGGTPDEFGDITINNGNIASIQTSDEINIFCYGASTSSANNQPNIQAAINRLSSEGGIIEVPVGDFTTKLPLVLPVNGGITIKGISSNESRIVKVGTTPASGIPLRLIPGGGGASDDLNVDAVVICDHGDNSYHYRLSLDNIYLKNDPATTGYGMYAPRLAQSESIQSVLVGGSTAQAPFYSRDHWNSTWTRCDFQLGDFGFWVDPDTTTGGTSLTLTSCFVSTCTFGYSLKGVIYSSLIDCACDLTREGGAAYNINNNGTTGSNVNLIGCGTEQTVGRQLVVRGSTVNITGGLFGEGDAIQSLPSTFFSEGYLIEGESIVNFTGTQHTPKNFADGNFAVKDTSIFNILNPTVRGGTFGAINFTTESTASTSRVIDNEFDVIRFQQSGPDSLLDYYGAGDWTPAATDFTITPQGCTYVRVGDVVTVSGRLGFSAYAGGSPGATLVVTGLPFNYEANSLFTGSVLSDQDTYNHSIIAWSGTFSSSDQVIFTVQDGSSTVVTNGDVSGHHMQFQLSYKV